MSEHHDDDQYDLFVHGTVFFDVVFTGLESMPVRAIITKPANGTRLGASIRELNLRGAAWAGDYTVRAVDVSIDFGASWQRANVNQPKNRYDWQRWTATLKLPSEGYYEIWSRATDSRGAVQPRVAVWNPSGYFFNSWHSVVVEVTA